MDVGIAVAAFFRRLGLLRLVRLLGGEDAVFVSTDELVDVVDEGHGVDGRRGADVRDGVDHLHEPDVSGVRLAPGGAKLAEDFGAAVGALVGP